MDSSSPLCGSRMQRGNQRGAMAWDVSQIGIHKDHYSPSHEGGPEDSCNLQPCPLPKSFHKIVGAEALDGNVHLEGHPPTRFIFGFNKIAGAQVSAPVQ